MAETTTEAPGWAALVPPIFAACVDREATRYALGAPFLVDGSLYATDGRICVRMPWPGDWPQRVDGRVPKGIGVVFGGGNFQADPTPIPAVEGACRACGGGRILAARTCRECDGAGREDVFGECDCPHCSGSHECPECDGVGKLPAGPCTVCHASGLRDPNMGVEVAPGYEFARKYLAILRDCGATLYLSIARPTKGNSAAQRFVVGEVEGRLMPKV